MLKKYICSKDIDKIYSELEELCADGQVCDFPIVVCVQNFDGRIPKQCKRGDEIKEKLPDLLDKDGGCHFRFNHGSKYFSKDIFASSEGDGYVSQFDRAVELIKNAHHDKAVMQVVLPDMIQGKVVPIPAALTVALKPRKGESYLDIIATYRIQEFSTWWPLNILELSQIQKMAVEELLPNYSEGYIYTISFQGLWNEQVDLGNMSQLDDKNKREELFKNITHLFNLSSNEIERKKKACDDIIIALIDKKNMTNAFSYDIGGMAILLKRLEFAGDLLSVDKTKNQNNIKVWKDSYDRIIKMMPKVIEKLNECGERYNKHHTHIEKWITEVQQVFDELIGHFEFLRQELQRQK